jgi:Ni,Fe-hydrogenase I cytochrome b subunit
MAKATATEMIVVIFILNAFLFLCRKDKTRPLFVQTFFEKTPTEGPSSFNMTGQKTP